MINNGNISEKLKLDVDAFVASSAATSSSKKFGMADYNKAAILVSVYSVDVGTPVIDLVCSTASTSAGSTNSSVAGGITLGSSVNTAISPGRGVKQFTLTMASGATGATGDAFTLCGKTFVFSTTGTTSISTLNTATKLYWGSSLGSTEDGGIKGSIESLKAAIEGTGGFGGMISVTTGTTANAAIALTDSATMNELVFGSTGSTLFVTAVVNAAAGGFEIGADEISAQGYTHFGITISSVKTAGQAGVTVIRTGGINPSEFKGVFTKNT